MGLLNLMPQKAVTELDIARTLQTCRPADDWLLVPLKIKGQTYKTTPAAHMEACYVDFEEMQAHGGVERLIITGAPLEQIAFEEVRYWEQLCDIMNWADKHVAHSLYICWGAQAGLYHFYGIEKRALSAKCFGIFTQQVKEKQNYLMKGLGDAFPMPHSRHTTIDEAQVLAQKSHGLQIVAAGEESGISIVATEDGRRTFVLGHLEYEPHTLDNEYRRDLAKGLPIQAPLHYYNKEGGIDHTWQHAACTFYRNWLESGGTGGISEETFDKSNDISR